MKFEFESQITRLEGKIKWTVFYFPYSAAEHFGTNGNIPVKITVDGHSFDHTLLPSKNGHYLVYNEFIKRAAGKNPGDIVYVTLERDMQRQSPAVPEYIENALKTAGVYEAFEKQPAYLKREQVNRIEISKKDETKRNRTDVLIKLLSEGNQ